MSEEVTGPVVVATQKLTGGPVVRWYRSMDAARARRPVLSASRKGVQVHGEVYLHEVPDEWMAAAVGAWEALRCGDARKARQLATHRVKGFIGDLVPVAPAEPGSGAGDR